jgi:hypothetical protein
MLNSRKFGRNSALLLPFCTPKLVNKPICVCRQVLSILLFLCSAPTAMTATSNEIKVGVSDIPMLLSEDADTKGLYNQVLDSMQGIKVLYLPPVRAEKMFHGNALDCLFPASAQGINTKQPLLQSKPVSTVNAYFFTLGSYQDTQSLLYKTVALRRGFSYGNIRKKLQGKVIELDSDIASLKFLSLGRVDAVIGYLPDIQAASMMPEISMPFFVQSLPVYTSEDAFVCYQNEETLVFIERVNRHLAKIKKPAILAR